MSIKKLFDSTDKTRQYLTDQDQKTAFKEIESSRNLQQLKTKQDSFLPQVDYTEPGSFAKFGSAYLYYKSAVERILDFYPYDGSDAELNTFYNKSLSIEKYIFNNLYPRRTGYATLSVDGWSTVASSSAVSSSDGGGYGLPSTTEYITFYGGPNVSSDLTDLKDMESNPLSSKFQTNNIYDQTIYDTAGLRSDYGQGTRESNLKSDFDTGVTVEFWLKTGSLAQNLTGRQVVFDMWNNEATGSTDYARLTIELTSSHALGLQPSAAGPDTPFLITAQSGTLSASAQSIITSSIGQSIADTALGDWAHYAFVLQNTGSDFVAELYVNGYHNATNTYSGITLNELQTKNMVGRIGALLTAPSGAADDPTVAAPGATANFIGAGKLSGSIDEFRFWKVARDGAQIGKNWFDQIRGGVNTDISNTELGMYYKFNEGNTGVTSIDSVVLDYGGRICNGTWTGYTSTSRNTGSAILSASAAIKEYEDPIIYPEHPSVSSLKTALLTSGSYYDSQNSGLVRNLVPSWMTDNMEISDGTDLDKICHILGTYFDKLHMQISALPTFKHLNYTSASHEPLPFSQHLPQSLGLYAPEVFIDATILEKFKNRTDNKFFESDLKQAKDLIYSNLYNNLAKIYKAKGTEKAIRNVLRCFNLNDSLVSYKVYSNNQQFELKSNLKQVRKNEKHANFNSTYATDAVIHQYADPHTGSTRGYIAGSNEEGKEDRYGFTAETSVVFPKFIRSLDTFSRNFKDVSVFGMQTVNTASTSDTAFLTYTGPADGEDWANFQVYAIRDTEYSKNVYFKLTSSVGPHPFPTLTSSAFFDVYDDSNWNLSVRIKPSSSFTDLLQGPSSSYSSYSTYDVIFRGVNNNLGVIQNSFVATGSVTKEVGKNILKHAKRMYCGARNTNITGSNIHKSDVLVSSLKYWTKYIGNTSLDQHLFDGENYGISGSYESPSPIDSGSVNTFNFNTLALNWYFGNVTSSNAGGEFYVTDLSSGSAEFRNNFGWMADISSHLHSGKGVGFSGSATHVVDGVNTNYFKFVDPEQVVASDQVQVLTHDDEIFGLVEQVPNYVYSIEKSLYGAVTEEILDFFAGAIDFHNLIGQPVNRYRERYKSLEYLRKIYFDRVQNVQTVEKFTEYYKWFDDTISTIIGQLVPASANFVEDTFNIVESHVLERHKYQTKFPTLQNFTTVPETELTFGPRLPWSIIRSPLELSPRPTNIKKEYWQRRAETDAVEITSGDATVDSQRQTIKNTMWARPHLSKSMPTFSTKDGTRYHYDANQSSQAASTYVFDAKIIKNIKGGVNFDGRKSLEYTFNALQPAGPVNTDSSDLGSVFVPRNVLLGKVQDLVQIQELEQQDRIKNNPGAKVKRVIKVESGRDFEDGVGYTTTKSTFSFPFNIMSSSVKSGHNKEVLERVTASVEITNLHNDVYGDDMERPMQGPWSEYAAGGHQSRHVPLNKYDANKNTTNNLDYYTTRPEAWKIVLGDCGAEAGETSRPRGAVGMVGPDYPWPEANAIGERPYPMTASQKAVYYRDHIAKTPYVFKNIHMRTGSTILGNYRHNYEVIQTVGASSNPRQFIKNQPTLPTEAFQDTAISASVTRTFLDIHRDSDGHFEFMSPYSISYLNASPSQSSVIVSKFSNPGGLEVSPAGYRDIRANEFSVYNAINYRNLSVIKPSQGPSGSVSEAVGTGTGSGGPGIRVTDIHSKDYGLRSHLARHTARFGRDSLWVTGDTYATNGPGASYDQLPGYHKVHRNNLNRVEICSTSLDSYNLNEVTNDYALYFSHSSAPNFQKAKLKHTGSFLNSAGEAITSLTWTISAWIRINDPGIANRKTIVSLGDNGGSTNADIAIGFNISAAEKLELWVKNTSNIGKWTGAYSIPQSAWHHVAVTYDGSSVGNDPIFYINGSQSATTEDQTPSAIAQSVNSVGGGVSYIGGTNYGNNVTHIPFWHALIDEVSIYSTVLDDSDISNIYSNHRILNLSGASVAPKTDDLVTWIRFGDGPGDPQSDALLTKSVSDNFGPVYYDVMGNNNYTLHGSTNPTGLFMASGAYGATTASVIPVASVLRYEEIHTYCTAAVYDNFNVQHQIPRSDKQYAWITGAMKHSTDLRYSGFAPTMGTLEGMYSSSAGGFEPFFSFVSASDFGSTIAAQGRRLFGSAQSIAGAVGGPGGFVPTDLVGLNTNIYESIDASTNTVGSNDLTVARNSTVVSGVNSEGSGALFNALMFHRGNVYGWGTFQQSRQGDHPILRNQRRNNKLCIEYKTPHVPQEFDLRPVSVRGLPVLVNFDYETEQIVKNESIIKTANATLKTSYNNEFIYFNSRSLDDHFNIPTYLKGEITPFEQLVALKDTANITLNWVHYKESLFPSLKNEFSPTSSFRLNYDNLMWRDSLAGRIELGSKTIYSNSLGIVGTAPDGTPGLSASSWPLDAPQGLLTRRNIPTVLFVTGGAVIKTSMTALRQGGAAMTGSGAGGSFGGSGNIVRNPGGVAGELQNTYGWLHQTSSNASAGVPLAGSDLRQAVMDSMTPAALYARKHTLLSPLSINSPNFSSPSCSVQDLGPGGGLEPKNGVAPGGGGFATASFGTGEAWWDAPETAGYFSGTVNAGTGEKVIEFVAAPSKPWYGDYDKFKETDLKYRARGYSVVPEYRISERIEDYLKGDVDDFNDFSIPGTEFDSKQVNFYKDFSNSDFMEKFLDIRQMSDLQAKEFKLTCHAVLKFNPYKGFYPADRTLQLVSQFSRSYGKSLRSSASIDPEYTTLTPLGRMPILLRPVLQPLFAPGILYNSIKAGMACDWPTITDGSRITKVAYSGSEVGGADSTELHWALYPSMVKDTLSGSNYTSGTFWDTRIPFEAIINPAAHMNGMPCIDMEPHPLVDLGGIVDYTASIAGSPADNLYTLMASNFVAEVGDFFLDGGNYSRLETPGVSLGTRTFSTGEVFAARLRLKTSYSGSRTYEYESSSHGNNSWFTLFGAGAVYNDATPDYNRKNGITTGSFEIPQDPNRNEGFRRDFVMYSRTTAFGPPIANRAPEEKIRQEYVSWSKLSGAIGGTPLANPIGMIGTATGINSGSWIANGNKFYVSGSAYGIMDCMNGYNWAYTPPYQHGEAWCDFIFRPTSDKEYSLEQMISELTTSYYRVDPGPQTSSAKLSWNINFDNYYYSSLIRDSIPLSGSRIVNNNPVGTPNGKAINSNNSPYASVLINNNAMQLSSSFNLFGIENVYKKRFDKFGREILTETEVVGKKWVIQPKFETPMLNFADFGEHPVVGSPTGSANLTKTVPMVGDNYYGFGADTAANGMWHQFGTVPARPNQGIFLEIGDIPSSWLQYHYLCVSESSVYNNFDPALSGPPGKSTLHETVQSLSEMMGFTEQNSRVRMGELSEKRVIKEAIVAVPYIAKDVGLAGGGGGGVFGRKEFISIPKARYKAATGAMEDSATGDSLDAAGQSIRQLVAKMKDYVLPKKFDFLRNPLVDPIVMYMFEFKYELDKDDLSYIWQNLAPRNYERLQMQKDVVAHELFNTELLTEKNIMENSNLRWMVFKVKQRSQKVYRDKIVPKLGTSTTDPIVAGTSEETHSLLYNWPYDYLSIVESVKLEAEVLYSNAEIELAEEIASTTATEEETSKLISPTATSKTLNRDTRSTIPLDFDEEEKVIVKKVTKGDPMATTKLSVSVKKKKKITKLSTPRKGKTKSTTKKK